MSDPHHHAIQASLRFDVSTSESLTVGLAGSWKLQQALPSPRVVDRELNARPTVTLLRFDASDLLAWDTGLLTFLLKVRHYGVRRQVEIDVSGLPEGVQRLLRMAEAGPGKNKTARRYLREQWLVRVGNRTIKVVAGGQDMLAFVGQSVLMFLRFLGGKARFRRVDFLVMVQECGIQALPIVALISFLVGLILAFVGAVQLQQFGAQIYVANLVGLGMVREMGAMMTGIILAGRTGAAFAAQLGTMRVNHEIDALSTLGISPMDFLVLPRMLALMLMMPLLCLYADLLGMLGGAAVGIWMLDLSAFEYFQQTRNALTVTDISLGLIKGAIYGILVALAGCMRGMQCGKSAAAVGMATTSAVVTGLVMIIVASAILTVIYNVLGY